MRDDTPIPNLTTLKDQARRLRSRLQAGGENIGHSRALELIAAQYGYNDWNTLHAALGNRRGPGKPCSRCPRDRGLSRSAVLGAGGRHPGDHIGAGEFPGGAGSG
jgi:hypothetical protein